MKTELSTSIAFALVFLGLVVLVALGKANEAILAAPLTGFLGWLAPGPRGRRAGDLQYHSPTIPAPPMPPPIPIDIEKEVKR